MVTQEANKAAERTVRQQQEATGNRSRKRTTTFSDEGREKTVPHTAERRDVAIVCHFKSKVN